MGEPNWVRARWRKSQRSGGQGDCVEFAVVDGLIGVRDSQNSDGPVLVFDRGSWRAFIDGVKQGEFDH